MESVDLLRRKLRYLCRRRATQELELILTRFWETHGQGLNDRELHELEAILSMDDMDLLAMCLGQKPFPPHFRRDLTSRLVRVPGEPPHRFLGDPGSLEKTTSALARRQT